MPFTGQVSGTVSHRELSAEREFLLHSSRKREIILRADFPGGTLRLRGRRADSAGHFTLLPEPELPAGGGEAPPHPRPAGLLTPTRMFAGKVTLAPPGRDASPALTEAPRQVGSPTRRAVRASDPPPLTTLPSEGRGLALVLAVSTRKWQKWNLAAPRAGLEGTPTSGCVSRTATRTGHPTGHPKRRSRPLPAVFRSRRWAPAGSQHHLPVL